MTSVYAYGTAHAVVMVGSFGAEGLKPRQIGPAHATIGRVNGQSRKALCGAYVTIDEQRPGRRGLRGPAALRPTAPTLAAL